MTREEAIKAIKANYPCGGYHKLCEALDIAIKTLEDFEALNAINLDLASENEDLVERIGKLIGYIDFLRNTAQGKKKSLNLLEKVVKGELEEIRAEGENFVKPRTGYISIDDVMSVFDDFMCGDVDEEGTETFLEMLKDKAESVAENGNDD